VQVDSREGQVTVSWQRNASACFNARNSDCRVSRHPQLRHATDGDKTFTFDQVGSSSGGPLKAVWMHVCAALSQAISIGRVIDPTLLLYSCLTLCAARTCHRQAHGQDARQEDVYAGAAASLVGAVLEGFNATVLAYGQTGCGKTYTMEGWEVPAEERGIVPRAFDHIFREIERGARCWGICAPSPDRTAQLCVNTRRSSCGFWHAGSCHHIPCISCRPRTPPPAIPPCPSPLQAAATASSWCG
jgi:hypothetical protein